MCCLVETFPARHESLEDFLRTLKFAYLYAKTVTLGRTHWPETNRVMLRNRRIGCSMSGIAQFVTKNGLEIFRDWCENGYTRIQSWDKIYSEYFAIPRSIKTTSVKPSGTVSLLAGATPGMHFPNARFYIRRVRMSNTTKYRRPLEEAGYKIEPTVGSEDSSIVVEIPIDAGEGMRSVGNISMWEQLSLAAFMQRHWADNQVSCTVTFDPETEGAQIKYALEYFQYHLKGISFLPNCNTVYPQLPYEPIDAATYAKLSSKLSPVNFCSAGVEQAIPDRFCEGDKCVM